MLKVCFVLAFYTYLVILVAIQNSTGSKNAKLRLAIQVASNDILLHFGSITNS